jgi:hypothetical protein
VLDTQGLDLINFNPDPAVREKVQKRAKRSGISSVLYLSS